MIESARALSIFVLVFRSSLCARELELCVECIIAFYVTITCPTYSLNYFKMLYTHIMEQTPVVVLRDFDLTFLACPFRHDNDNAAT